MTEFRWNSATAVAAAMLAGSIVGLSCKAFAWGNTGHVEVSRLAIEMLPDELPAFLRSPAAARAIGELGPEPDRSKTAGPEHDQELDPGHFVDLDDDGKVVGVIPVTGLPATRQAYDTALRAAGQSEYSAGYLSYNIVIGWQQLRKEFAYWRADVVGLRTATTPEDLAFFRYDLQLRQQLIIRDLGVWSHYVADASQPLHVSVHFNGWGDFPNPDGFTNDRGTHARFEGAFVRDNVTLDAIAAAVPDARDCGCAIEERTVQYLQASLAQVVPLYRLATAGAFAGPNAEGSAFAAQRLGAGIAELRDMVVDAWRSSATWVVGFPLIQVKDVESGAAQLTRSSYASD